MRAHRTARRFDPDQYAYTPNDRLDLVSAVVSCLGNCFRVLFG
jgi:hypothetical protein